MQSNKFLLFYEYNVVANYLNWQNRPFHKEYTWAWTILIRIMQLLSLLPQVIFFQQEILKCKKFLVLTWIKIRVLFKKHEDWSCIYKDKWTKNEMLFFFKIDC